MPQIDPKLAIVWRSEHQLQFGAPTARAVLDCPERVQLDLVHLLRHGAGIETLNAVAAGAGGGPRDVEAVLRELAPVLDAPEPPSTLHSADEDEDAFEIVEQRPVVVCGDGSTAVTVSRILKLLGYYVLRAPIDEPLVPDDYTCLVVLVADRVIPTAVHLPLLRRDIPHVPVVFGEDEVTVGPLVSPGESACLRCVDLARRDIDPAWPLIAAQLPDQPPAARLPRLELAAASAAIRAADARLTGHSSVLDGVAEIITPGASHPLRVSYPPHPECGCGIHPGNETRRAPLAIRRLGEPSSPPDDVVPG